MNLLKKLFNNYIVLSVVCVVLGIALLIDPEFFTRTISYTIAGISIGVGVLEFIRFASKGEERGEYNSLIVKGAILCIIGIFLIINWDFIPKVAAVCLGIYALFSGAVSLSDALECKRNGLKWEFSLVLAIATIVLGLVMVTNPLAPVNFALQILGIAMIVTGVINFVNSGALSNKLRNLEKAVNKSEKAAKKNKDSDVIDVKFKD